MDSEADVFDDPGLKAAIRRAWAGEQAPPELRGRVEKLLAPSIPASSPRPARSLWPPISPLWGLAAAAAIVLALGIAFWPTHRRTALPLDSSTLPPTLVADLYQTHDGCSSAPDHHMPGIPREGYPQIGRGLAGMLHIPVLSGDPSGPWNFRGASICKVGQRKCGHLVFAGGNQAVSLFSLPADAWKAPPGNPDCCQGDSHHAVAGFATASGFYCVVGSSTDGSLSVERVRQVREHLKNDLFTNDSSLAAAKFEARSSKLETNPNQKSEE